MDMALHKDAVTWIDSIEQSRSHTRVEFFKSDVSKWADLEKAFDVYAATFGGVPYIVCAGAGIYEPVSLSMSLLVLERH
jgi:3-hydroxybutyrate dehydrogenase